MTYNYKIDIDVLSTSYHMATKALANLSPEGATLVIIIACIIFDIACNTYICAIV